MAFSFGSWLAPFCIHRLFSIIQVVGSDLLFCRRRCLWPENPHLHSAVSFWRRVCFNLRVCQGVTNCLADTSRTSQLRRHEHSMWGGLLDLTCGSVVLLGLEQLSEERGAGERTNSSTASESPAGSLELSKLLRGLASV